MMLNGRAEADRVMSERGWLCHVPKKFSEEVLRRAQPQHFPAGKPVFHLGDPAGGIYGLVNGTVSVSIAPAGAAPRLVLLGVPGHWTGEACFLTRQPRRGEFRAVADATLLHLPLQALDQMAALDPQVIRYVAFILMMSVELLLRVVHDLQKPDSDRRIASILQRTASTGGVEIPLTQTQIGIMANTSRKQVNAALRRFSEAGWLENTYRSIRIIDMAALHHFAESDDAGGRAARPSAGPFGPPKRIVGRKRQVAMGVCSWSISPRPMCRTAPAPRRSWPPSVRETARGASA